MKIKILIAIFLSLVFKMGFAATLIGTELSIKTLAQATPTSEEFYLGFETFAVVSDSFVEYPNVGDLNNPASGAPPGFSGNLVDTAIDVGSDYIEIDFDNSSPYYSFASGYQNTYIFTFDSAVALNISGAEIDSSVTTLGLAPSDVSFVGNELFVNVESLTFNTSTFVRINLSFDEAGSIYVRDSDAPNFDRNINFGAVEELKFSDQFVAVKNEGSSIITLGNLAVADALTEPFRIMGDSCSGQSLMPEANCMVTIRFEPRSIGSFSDTFDIPSDSADTVTMSLTGEGVGMPVADITVSDSSLPADDLQIPFGNVTQMTSSSQVVTVRNDGNSNLVIGNIASANPLISPFGLVADACSNQVMLPGASCTLSVRFEPTGLGSFSDGFDIPSNDQDEPFIIMSVNGSGVIYSSIADIEVTDSTTPVDDLLVDFGEVKELESSVQIVTIANNGDASLIIDDIASDNPLNAPFEMLEDNCSMMTLAPTENCILAIRFSPISGNEVFQDSFDIPSSDPDESVLTVAVKGSGLVCNDEGSPATDGNSPPVDDGGSSSSGGTGSFNILFLSLLSVLVIVVRLSSQKNIS